MILQNKHLFLEFSYLSVLNKGINNTINDNDNTQQSWLYNDFRQAFCYVFYGTINRLMKIFYNMSYLTKSDFQSSLIKWTKQ